MRRLSALLFFLLLTCFAHAQNRPEPIRLCVSTLQNSSHSAVDTAWQRNQLIKMFERINKSKDVTKGKAARIDTVPLESNRETDPAVRDNNCQFILHANIVEVLDSGAPEASSRARSVEIGSARDDPRANAPNDNRATVAYRLMRAGELEPWSSDELTAHDPLPDAMLISHLMDQVANRVFDKLRERR
jgi:hypothetical protein